MNTNTIYKIKTIKINLAIKNKVMENTIDSPQRVFLIAKEIFKNLDADQEHFVIITNDAGLNPTGFKVIHSGGTNYSEIDLKILFRNAILLGAHSIFLIHNHPTGKLKPSGEDIITTNKIVEAGKIIDIKVVDHLIISEHSNNYYSFSENGLLGGDK